MSPLLLLALAAVLLTTLVNGELLMMPATADYISPIASSPTFATAARACIIVARDLAPVQQSRIDIAAPVVLLDAAPCFYLTPFG